jgi:hypothetical protein
MRRYSRLQEILKMEMTAPKQIDLKKKKAIKRGKKF